MNGYSHFRGKADKMAYKRILLKLSGESLMGNSDGLYDQDFLARIAGQLKACREEGGGCYRGILRDKSKRLIHFAAELCRGRVAPHLVHPSSRACPKDKEGGKGGRQEETPAPLGKVAVIQNGEVKQQNARAVHILKTNIILIRIARHQVDKKEGNKK